MPSAAQLQSLAQHGTGHAAHVEGNVLGQTSSGAGAEQVVAQVISDALAGGHGHGAIDQALEGLPSHDGSIGSLHHFASHSAGGVSDGDNGHLAAFSAVHHASMEHAIAMAHAHAAAHPHG
jgi:hypothetical protein